MTICPKCKAENRPEAAFCANCGNILLNVPTQSRVIQNEPTQAEPAVPVVSDTNIELTPPRPVPPPPVEEPLPSPSFSSRPEGSIFGERFQYDRLVSVDEHEIRYVVVEKCDPSAACVRVCTNPGCRTIHMPAGDEPEKFCTYCGKPLVDEPPLFLREANTDRFADQQAVINLNLAHPNIHPPVAIFQEEMPSGMHYSLVTPYSQELPPDPDLAQVLEWGKQLASGLDYLHSYGIAFGPEIDLSNFGLLGEKIVWRSFESARVLPMLADREKINNVRLLALCLYSWITGKTQYSTNTSLNPRLNRLFHQALIGEGFTSGIELAQQIEQVINAGLSPFNLDYIVGRRTHTGQVRSNNEDSLLSFSISNVQQGISQPFGIYAIADGMGGHATGDIASSLAIQTIALKSASELTSLQNCTPEEYTAWLRQAVQGANQSVYASRQRAKSDMGSTLDCALLFGDKAYLIHLGDSRIYHLRSGSINQLTTDHSIVQQMVALGKITPEEARTHPQRNVIYRSLGETLQVEPDIIVQELLPGDKILLCSDGLNGMLDDQKIQIIVHESTSPQNACDYLVDAANLAGGEDNISVIIVEVITA